MTDALQASEDVEQSKATVTSRGSAEQEENAFCELIPDGYLRTDALGVIRKANAAAAALLRQPQWSLVGKPIFLFVDTTRRRPLRRLVNGLAQEAGVQEWILQLDNDAELLTLRTTVAAIRDAGGRMTGVRWLLAPHAAASEGEEDDPPHPVRGIELRTPPGGTEIGAHYSDMLRRTSALLGSSFDIEATLRAVARLAVPVLGDWCFIDLDDPNTPGRWHRLAAERAATEPRELMSALGPGMIVPRPEHVAGGETQLVQPVDEEFLANQVESPAALDALTQLRPTAWLAEPLQARGRVLGQLVIVIAGSRRPLPAPVRSVVHELAQRVALAADNVWLYQRAMEANAAKSAFLATMSHELRTPLTAIIGYTELLRDGVIGPVPAPQETLLARIRESSDHLLALVEGILGYARLEAAEERLEVERVELDMILDPVIDMVTPMAQRKNLALPVERPDEPVWLNTDLAKVRQVLVNLLGNAIKFTDAGEVRLRVYLERGEDRSAGTAHEPIAVVFEVRDTGIGIPRELLSNVFEPFWQVEQRATRRYGGTGLGLSVVRQITQLLGGEVQVNSDPGKGSTFRVRLPMRTASGVIVFMEEAPDADAETGPSEAAHAAM